MKKIIALFIAVILVCSMMSFTTSAAIPTELTIKETKTAPNINDGGKIDSVYGAKLFDIKASEHPLDSGNLYPSKKDGRDGDKLSDPKVKAAIAKMRNIGYMTYDQENLYIACEVTDIAPKAASNNAEYWKSTNLQLTIFVNEELSFPTIAYEGTNKVKVWGDDRSVLDYELVEATFTEKSQTNYVYEIKIPWVAFPDVNSPKDVYYFSMGLVQSSMANGYVCSAFGEGFFLDASKTIPVTLVAASGETGNTGNNKDNATTSTDQNTASSNNGGNTTSKPANNTASSDKGSSNSNEQTTSSANNSQAASSDNNADANSTVTDSTNAPTTGTEIVTSSENATTESAADTQTEGTTTVVTEQAEKDWTPIIIIAIVAVVIIAGGAVAIVLLNKKPKEDK